MIVLCRSGRVSTWEAEHFVTFARKGGDLIFVCVGWVSGCLVLAGYTTSYTFPVSKPCFKKSMTQLAPDRHVQQVEMCVHLRLTHRARRDAAD